MTEKIPNIWVCRNCRLSLTEIETIEPNGTSNSEFMHAMPTVFDHAPEPILLRDLPGREMLTHCDLCSAPDPKNVWKTGSIGGLLQINNDTYQIRDRDNEWLICDDCEADVQVNNMKACFARLMDTIANRDPQFHVEYEQRIIMFQRMQGFFNAKTGKSSRRSW